MKRFQNEREGQKAFYEQMNLIPGYDYEIKHNNDGTYKSILFEFKNNISDRYDVLSQAVNYLSILRYVGENVPYYIGLIDIKSEVCYIYESYKFSKYINQIPQKKSSIAKFLREDIEIDIDNPYKKINDCYNTGITDIRSIAEKNIFFKITIDEHCVSSWAKRYYELDSTFTKKDFIDESYGELFRPSSLKDFIEPYKGSKHDFKKVSDKLNPKKLQKQIGAFYTPKPYAKKTAEECRVIKDLLMNTGKYDDYVIIDRCGGTGSLEEELDNDMLKHVIVSTYETQEWYTLYSRLNEKVLKILPEIGDVEGEVIEMANAMSLEYLENEFIKSYIDNPKCAVIFLENPPYVDATSNYEQSEGVSKSDTYMVNLMKENGMGKASNELCNQFVWSAKNLYNPDACIFYGPNKYWSIYHLMSQYDYLNAYLFNRKHFHASENGIGVISWIKRGIIENLHCADFSIDFQPIDITFENNSNNTDGILSPIQKTITVKTTSLRENDKVNGGFDKCKGINEHQYEYASLLNGDVIKTSDKKVRSPQKVTTADNMVGYMITAAQTFAALNVGMLSLRQYNGNGQYLYKENAFNNFPYFAASAFERYGVKDWYEKGVYTRGCGKTDEFRADSKFMNSCFVWSMCTDTCHAKSHKGIVKNQLCFDDNTWAFKKYEEIELTDKKSISPKAQRAFDVFRRLCEYIKDGTNECNQFYDSSITYGLFQINEDLNKYDKYIDGVTMKEEKIYKDSELNRLITELKKLLADLYLCEIAEKIKKYELVK